MKATLFRKALSARYVNMEEIALKKNNNNTFTK